MLIVYGHIIVLVCMFKVAIFALYISLHGPSFLRPNMLEFCWHISWMCPFTCGTVATHHPKCPLLLRIVLVTTDSFQYRHLISEAYALVRWANALCVLFCYVSMPTHQTSSLSSGYMSTTPHVYMRGPPHKDVWLRDCCSHASACVMRSRQPWPRR